MKKLFSILLVSFVCIYSLISCNSEGKKQEELKLAYKIQNTIFGDIVSVSSAESRDVYLSVNVCYPQPERIAYYTYVDLIFYKKETGTILTYAQVIDYLSQEFEDDGEIRIYTNGRHAEIAEFIEWAEENKESRRNYRYTLDDIYFEYSKEHKDFKVIEPYLIPTEMVDELIKKEADPNYEMDLLSIQQRWLDEGRARLSEDGRKIEYLPAS